jgi:hypothetical protein
MFSEKGIVLCLFNLKFFVQLDTWFTYLIWTVFSVVYSVFCIVLWHCTTLLLFFFCVLYCSLFLYCTVSACVVRAATPPEVFPCFSSVVRQMPGYNSQRRGRARTSQFTSQFLFIFNCCVLRPLYSVYCLCVNVYCTAATGCQPCHRTTPFIRSHY